jgi:protein-S-isoprenylcysteine O-methyltransferase Ste14
MPGDLVGLVAFGYAILSRLAYVLFVGIALRRQERDSGSPPALAPADAFRRFRRRAAFVMNNDGVAFIVLCVVTHSTLALPVSSALSIIAGVALGVIGVGTKVWAARTLGGNAYYWHNFFFPADARGPVTSGPYRYVSNPMYTIGYLHTYGLALMLRSLPGLIVAGFAQAAIFGFYLLVEKPHFERLHRESPH